MQSTVHRHNYRVIYGDTDTAGVMYYGTYMRLFEIGRTEYMRDIHKLSYKEFAEQGVILPVVEVYARYRSPARYDDMLVIETSLDEITRATVSFRYEIMESLSARLIVEGYTKHAATDHEGRLARMPRSLMDAANDVINP